MAATITVLIVVVAAFWFYLVSSYESELGTSNVVQIETIDSQSDASMDKYLAQLSFADDAEDLLWSSIEITLFIEDKPNSCSFGSQSNSEQLDGNISSKLSADGSTFTTVVDATDTESFSYLDVSQQLEVNESQYWMKFSSTDVFFGENIRWTFLEGVEFSEVEIVAVNELSNDTENRLEWYEYDLSVHRVNPNDGTYLIEKEDSWFKIKFLTYYNSEDESRYPTMQIAAVGNTSFPALQNPDLVVPSPCMIISDDVESDYWDSEETIILIENGVNLCDGKCSIKLEIKFETIAVEIDESEFELD